jgi:chromosome segregation ATPase
MYGVSTGGNSGNRLESSLDAVLQYTQENLDRIEQQKNKNSLQNVTLLDGSVNRMSTGSVSVASSQRIENFQRPARAASASRLNRSTSHLPDRTIDPRPLSTPSDSANHNRYDIIIKKIRILEDKMKKSDNLTTAQHNVLHDIVNQNDKLTEAQRQDKKTMHTLREQISSMKTRIDLLCNQGDLREKLAQQHLPIDMHYLNELITQRVTAEINQLLDKTTLSHLKHNNENNEAIKSILTNEMILDKQSNSNSNHVQRLHKTIVDQVSTIEKEVLKIKNDNDRMKSKQSYLDKVYTELKESVSIRELKNEETHKKCIQTYKNEYETLQHTTMRQIHEVMSRLNHCNVDYSDLKESLETHIQNTGSIMASFDMKLTSYEDYCRILSNQLNLLKSKDMELDSKVQELEKTLSVILRDCEGIQVLKDRLHDHDTHVHGHLTCQLQDLQHIITSNSTLIDSQAKDMVIMQTSFDVLQGQMSEQLQTLQHHQTDQTKKYLESINILRESQIKLKSKVKECTQHVMLLQERKGSLDALFATLQDKLIEEAKHVYEQTQHIQHLQQDMIVLEEKVNKSMNEKLETRLEEVDLTLKDLSAGNH